MKFEKIYIYYEEIFLEYLELKKVKSYTELVKYFKSNFEKNEFKINLSEVNTSPKINLFLTKNLNTNFSSIKVLFKNWLSYKSMKVIKYVDLVDALYEFNFAYVDNRIIFKGKLITINYTEIIAQRNLFISKSILCNYKNNSNKLICIFLMRDLIENIKLYLYFLIGSKKEEKVSYKNGYGIKVFINENIENEITEKLSNENQNWNFDIKDIIKNNQSLKIWEQELVELHDINDDCNNFIHKNGFSKISPKLIENNFKFNILECWFKIIKFYFTITACYDGKSLQSSDFQDYMDYGLEPPTGCQNWIAPIFQDFIDTEYSKEEKRNLIKQSYMEIK